MGRLKKMILGEKMPDKNDPEYREKYEKDVEAGRKFAKATRIERLAGHIQRFADRHSKLFLAIVFGIVAACFAINLHNMTSAIKVRGERQSAVKTQEMILKNKIHAPIDTLSTDGTTQEN